MTVRLIGLLIYYIHIQIRELDYLKIIGTSHIAKESVEEVKDTILKEKPDIIALELDRKRL